MSEGVKEDKINEEKECWVFHEDRHLNDYALVGGAHTLNTNRKEVLASNLPKMETFTL
jgi:hypothetical protein